MTKKTPIPQVEEPGADPWQTEVEAVDPADKAAVIATEITATDSERIQRAVQAHRATEPEQPEYDIDGLMTDFPTATDLERFVYDQTGHVLNLKGRANKLKYQVAMDVLNGIAVDDRFTGGENPYVDRSELVPVEDLKPVPDRDSTLPPETEIQNQFYTPFIPHPDPEYRAQNRKVHTVFRKYRNGMISFEVIGPIEPRAIGEKMDKFGRVRPELMSWVDPRTGEQVAARVDGTLTPHGRNLRAIMTRMRVNNTNYWEMWVDRDMVSAEGGELRNPWDLSS
jgi:hypothetical protein